MYIVLTLCLSLLIYALFCWHKRNVCGHKLPPIFPGALPLIGHNHIIYRSRRDLGAFLDKVIDFSVKSGGVTCFYFIDQIYYAITDTEDAATVAMALTHKHYLYRLGEPWLGKGLITASGPIYQSHRKLLNPAFSLSVAYGFLDVFNDGAKHVTDAFDNHVGQGPFDTSETFHKTSLRTTSIAILGAYGEKNSDFLNTYIELVQNILDTFKERFLGVGLHNDMLFGFTSIKKRQEECINAINNMMQETIDKRKIVMKNKVHFDNLNESDRGFRSFIDIMLEIAADGSLSDQEIKDELNTVAGASYETTARQLVYITILLGTYPDMQEKIFEEVMEVVGDRDLEKENISKLVYTEAFIKECMRILPIINLLPRSVDKDLKLKNYTLRANTSVLLLNLSLNKQPAWGPDSAEFRPERWLQKGHQLDNLFFSFGHGSRSCVGKKFAMVSMKVTVAHIVRKFKIKADFSKLKLIFNIVMEPESGHQITLERRNTK